MRNQIFNMNLAIKLRIKNELIFFLIFKSFSELVNVMRTIFLILVCLEYQEN